MKPMAYGIATHGWTGWLDCVKSWTETASENYNMYICCDLDVVPALQHCYEGTSEPIIAYIHDDVIIHEQDWDKRVLKEFEDESVGLVGFGCGIGHCRPELHSVPFRIPLLARQDFISNLRDAETHGTRFKGERDVAVCDGFAVFIRRKVLDKWGGFPQGVNVGYFMIWENTCCEVRRQGYRIRCVGVDCTHLGGRTSVQHTPEDVRAKYEAEHLYFFQANKDMIPWRAPE